MKGRVDDEQYARVAIEWDLRMDQKSRLRGAGVSFANGHFGEQGIHSNRAR